MKHILFTVLIAIASTFHVSAPIEIREPYVLETSLSGVVASSRYIPQTKNLKPYLVEPRLKYLSAVFTDCTVTNGQANCQGNFSIMGTRRVQLVVVLQKSTVNNTDDTYWSPVISWAESWYTSGTHVLARSYTQIDDGYYYRTETKATVFDYDNITPLEIVIVHSLVQSYKKG